MHARNIQGSLQENTPSTPRTYCFMQMSLEHLRLLEQGSKFFLAWRRLATGYSSSIIAAALRDRTDGKEEKGRKKKERRVR